MLCLFRSLWTTLCFNVCCNKLVPCLQFRLLRRQLRFRCVYWCSLWSKINVCFVSVVNPCENSTFGGCFNFNSCMYDGPGRSHCLPADGASTAILASAISASTFFILLLVLLVVVVLRKRKRNQSVSASNVGFSNSALQQNFTFDIENAHRIVVNNPVFEEHSPMTQANDIYEDLSAFESEQQITDLNVQGDNEFQTAQAYLEIAPFLDDFASLRPLKHASVSEHMVTFRKPVLKEPSQPAVVPKLTFVKRFV